MNHVCMFNLYEFNLLKHNFMIWPDMAEHCWLAKEQTMQHPYPVICEANTGLP